MFKIVVYINYIYICYIIMNSAGTNISSTIPIISKICFRCGRNNHSYLECYASTDKNGKKLGYCTCLRCR